MQLFFLHLSYICPFILKDLQYLSAGDFKIRGGNVCPVTVLFHTEKSYVNTDALVYYDTQYWPVCYQNYTHLSLFLIMFCWIYPIPPPHTFRIIVYPLLLIDITVNNDVATVSFGAYLVDFYC